MGTSIAILYINAATQLFIVFAGLGCCSSAYTQTLVKTSNQSSDENQTFEFPQNFTFSLATSAYQVEGAWNISGKGENIWDRLVHTKYPPLMNNNDTGDVTCDSYHNFKTDVQLLKRVGVKMYRFSLSWSRILPRGSIDIINEDGIRYYNDLINELIHNNITPMVTIFHWDLPQALQDIGGWPNSDVADYYVDYADLVFASFGDRVKWWVTFNEPQSFCFNGYADGNLAPGIESSGRADYLCGHTMLKAHGRAYHLYKNKYAATQKGKVSMVSIAYSFEPNNTSSAEDQAAAERAMQFFLGFFSHPIFSTEGNYPPIVIDLVNKSSIMQGLKRSRLPSFTAEEVEMIKNTGDFFGLNFYSSYLTTAVDPSVNLVTRSRWNDALAYAFLDPKLPRVLANWMKVTPWGFRRVFNWIRTNYNNPEVFVTENGFADRGESLIDLDRIHFYRLYLNELLKALHIDGCRIIGFTAWSLVDNFEWFAGYEHKYGLFSVDFKDPARNRTAKMSSKFFEMMISSRRIPEDSEIHFPGFNLSTTTESSR